MRRLEVTYRQYVSNFLEFKGTYVTMEAFSVISSEEVT